MCELYIVGMGPGSAEYLLPRAKEVIHHSDLLIGAKRHLEPYQDSGKELVYLTGLYEHVLKETCIKYPHKRISLLVSGDPGYHSPLELLITRMGISPQEVVPGLSSFQYLHSRVALPWQTSTLLSLHGGNGQDVQKIPLDSPATLLLDRRCSPRVVAEHLMAHGYGNREVALGYDLSYENELIIRQRACEVREEKERTLCVMILL